MKGLTITIKDSEDKASVLICAIRYAFGSEPYMPSLVLKAINGELGILLNVDLARIYVELVSLIHSGKDMHMEDCLMLKEVLAEIGKKVNE